MKTTATGFRLTLIACLGIAFSTVSCMYDPYSTSTRVGASYGYSDGYGYGYGHGSRGFTTSYFVSTGNPRWAYDPYCMSYYDYNRRAYYDPYLYGYYPVGYRPPVIVGAPHPYGWRPGRGVCPPPSRVRDYAIQDYRNREGSYRRTNYAWANQVRAKPGRATSRGSGTYDVATNPNRRTIDSRPAQGRATGAPAPNRAGGTTRGRTEERNVRPGTSGARVPSGYNQPVRTEAPRPGTTTANRTRQETSRQAVPPPRQQTRPQAAPPPRQQAGRQAVPPRQEIRGNPNNRGRVDSPRAPERPPAAAPSPRDAPRESSRPAEPRGQQQAPARRQESSRPAQGSGRSEEPRRIRSLGEG